MNLALLIKSISCQRFIELCIRQRRVGVREFISIEVLTPNEMINSIRIEIETRQSSTFDLVQSCCAKPVELRDSRNKVEPVYQRWNSITILYDRCIGHPE